MLLVSLGDYFSVHSVRKHRLKRTIALQLSDFISADRNYCSHGFIDLIPIVGRTHGELFAL